MFLVDHFRKFLNKSQNVTIYTSRKLDGYKKRKQVFLVK